jgi:hypothetical protein
MRSRSWRGQRAQRGLGKHAQRGVHLLAAQEESVGWTGFRDHPEMLQSLQHALGHHLGRVEGRHLDHGFDQLGLGVLHNDAPHPGSRNMLASLPVSPATSTDRRSTLMRSQSQPSAAPLLVSAGSTSRSRPLE